jgi:MerR family transcriptional regulator, redox-sensitive transcriptional activator SoxR
MSELSIGEVAQQAGVRTSTLRYYERIGLLPPARRIGGRRRYDASVLQTLSIIQTAQQAGFTVAEIGILVNKVLPRTTPPEDWEELTRRKLGEVDKLLTQVQSMKALLEDVLRCDYQQLADCIYVAGQKHGVTETENSQALTLRR